ncbi:hypothetical protein BUY11_11585 [Staphylococcus chromogenes]|uniref:hypothetical protein n=1 Tax=Staphylococcus chromogenes TaxID=46126 RepID=UPI000D1C7422|nr:hypothetical protein [Staphylococcus chromogenes]MEB7451600.1 hypothetical protein [Staphylococcus chromogenes]PTF40263.1 hypothetical protein BUY11_11585 [Staphylococcus chromogenes]QDW82147.1 hypothetical protein DWB92_05140 [Staphylococcus chromogenes]
MSDENKYVLRHEWESARGKIYEKINENDRKHTEALNNLEKTVDRQTILQERSFESQERSEKHLEKLNNTMESFGKDFTDVKYKVQSHDEKLQSVQGIISEKQKANVQITTVFISGVFTVIVAAIGLAKYFF